MQDLHGLLDDVLHIKSPSGLNRKDELVVVLRDFDHFLEAEVLSALGAFLTESAIIGVFDVDGLPSLIETKHLPGALCNELSSLSFSHLLLHLLLVELNDWLLHHSASRNWGPLGMDLADSFLGDQLEIELLIFG